MAAIKRKRGIMDGEAINGRQSQKDKVRNKKRKKHRMGERWGNEKLRYRQQEKGIRQKELSNKKRGRKRQRAVHNEFCPTFTKAALNHALLGSTLSQCGQDTHTYIFCLICTHCTCKPSDSQSNV